MWGTLPTPIEPTADEVRTILETQRSAELTYTPKPYTRHQRTAIGSDFDRAARDLRHWRQYDLGWTRLAEPRPPIAVGEHMATLARVCGGWTVNCCRIVDVHDTPDAFGYTIGTLPHHSEIGEEQFRVERVDGTVWFDVQSHSGPGNWFVRTFWPLAERAIQRFLRESAQALQQDK